MPGWVGGVGWQGRRLTLRFSSPKNLYVLAPLFSFLKFSKSSSLIVGVRAWPVNEHITELKENLQM